MAKVFKDEQGKVYQLEDVTEVGEDTDIMSEKAVAWFAELGDEKVSISREVYNTIKKLR